MVLLDFSGAPPGWGLFLVYMMGARLWGEGAGRWVCKAGANIRPAGTASAGPARGERRRAGCYYDDGRVHPATPRQPSAWTNPCPLTGPSSIADKGSNLSLKVRFGLGLGSAKFGNFFQAKCSNECPR